MLSTGSKVEDLSPVEEKLGKIEAIAATVKSTPEVGGATVNKPEEEEEESDNDDIL